MLPRGRTPWALSKSLVPRGTDPLGADPLGAFLLVVELVDILLYFLSLLGQVAACLSNFKK